MKTNIKFTRELKQREQYMYMTVTPEEATVILTRDLHPLVSINENDELINIETPLGLDEELTKTDSVMAICAGDISKFNSLKDFLPLIKEIQEEIK